MTNDASAKSAAIAAASSMIDERRRPKIALDFAAVFGRMPSIETQVYILREA